MSTKELVRKYQTILNNNGLGHKKVVEVIVTRPDLIGEHLSSECFYVTLKLANCEPDYELFVKASLPHFEIMELGPDEGCSGPFDKEPDFFNVVLPDLQAYYMKNSGSDKPMDFFPKCFYADKKEIIMENLVKMRGYFLNPKEEGQNLEYSTMALENLAQFHAVSYSLMKEIGEEAAMEKYKYAMREVMYTPSSPLLGIIDNGKVVADEIVKNHDVPGGDRAIRTLKKYGTNLCENLIELISPKSKNLCLVMTHGDFWNSNMMFLKDPETGKLKHNIFIDFQVGRIGSPNLDLTYFIFACVRPEVRKQSLKLLLELYYKKFSSLVELLTKSPFPYSFEEFVADFEAKSLLGFWMNIILTFLLEIMATMDPSKVEGEFMPYFENHILKWIRENPERASKQAEKIVEICDEYEQFVARASEGVTRL